MLLTHLDLSDRFVDNDGVRIHYMAGGSGPLVVLLHGFPDAWFTWRHQIAGLLPTHSVAALDMRGYNLSDAPEGVEHYSLDRLASDVAAVIANENYDAATVVGHDWGGSVAWHTAARHPDLVERLVVVNVPHPEALRAELERPSNRQAAALAYADDFRAGGSEARVDPAELAAFRAGNDEDRVAFEDAFRRSDPAAMMNYYRQPASGIVTGSVGAPVIQFHGLDDPALLVDSVNRTWEFVTAPWTLVTVPGAGHWVHEDQPDLVTDTLVDWLGRDLPAGRRSEEPLPTVASTSGCCG